MFGRENRKVLQTGTMAKAQIKPGDCVLDVGCGTGDVVVAAAREVGDGGAVIGVDPSDDMLAAARAKCVKSGVPLSRVQLLQGDCSVLAWSGGFKRGRGRDEPGHAPPRAENKKGFLS